MPSQWENRPLHRDAIFSLMLARFIKLKFVSRKHLLCCQKNAPLINTFYIFRLYFWFKTETMVIIAGYYLTDIGQRDYGSRATTITLKRINRPG